MNDPQSWFNFVCACAIYFFVATWGVHALVKLVRTVRRKKLYSGASCVLTINGMPIKGIKAINYDSQEASARVIELEDNLGDIWYFLEGANAKKKQFEKAYKKARRKAQELRGEVVDAVMEKRAAEQAQLAAEERYRELVGWVVDRKPIEVTLPQMTAKLGRSA